MPFSEYFKDIRKHVDIELDRLVPAEDTFPPNIHESMRYSLFAGGKRLRPMLAVAACECVGGSRGAVMPFAASLELIHTYTLIHDDLPAIDNDDLRRGKPTNHKKFGDATAILAGDGLLTHAFELLSDRALFAGLSAETQLAICNETANAIGATGTIGGQVVDIEYENSEPDLAILEYIHINKTGKLITASVRGGAIVGGGGEDQLKALTDYSRHIGLAFQVIDDILDIEGEEASLGKRTGADARKKKMTYPYVAGIEESKKRAGELVDVAIESLEMFDEGADHLRDLAKYIVARAF